MNLKNIITSKVYLIEAISKTRERALKIGFSNDLLGSRKSSYESSSNMSDYLDNFTGDMVDELSTHLYFHNNSLGKGELFEYSSEIIEEFNKITKDDIYKYLWDHVEDLYLINDIIELNTKKHKSLLRCIEYNKKYININELPDTRFGRELKIFIIKNKLLRSL